MGSSQDGSLHGGTVCDRLVWVDASVQLLPAKEILQQGLDLGDTGGSPNKNDVVDLAGVQLSIFQYPLHRLKRFFEEVQVNLLKLGSRKLLREVQPIRKVFHLNASLRQAGELPLRLLTCSPQAGQGTLVLTQVSAVLCHQNLQELVHQSSVKVLATQVSIPSRGNNFKESIFDVEQGNVQGSSSQVENQNVALKGKIQAVSDGSRSGLIHDPQHIQPSNGCSVLDRRPLHGGEIGWTGNNGPLDFLANMRLRDGLHFYKNEGKDFLGCVMFNFPFEADLNNWSSRLFVFDDPVRQKLQVPLDLEVVKFASEEALDRKNSIFRVRRLLIERLVANEYFFLGESHDRRGDPISQFVGNDLYGTIDPGADNRKCGAQVDSNERSIQGRSP
eukprot:RCo018624